MQQKKEAWKNKYKTLEVSYSTILKEKDYLIEILESCDVRLWKIKRIYYPVKLGHDLAAHFLTLVVGKKSLTSI